MSIKDVETEAMRRAVEHLSLAQGMLEAAAAPALADETRCVLYRAIAAWHLIESDPTAKLTDDGRVVTQEVQR
jgi:hypothetical protein